MLYLSQINNVVQNLRSDGRGQILVLIASGWFLSIGVRMIYPALLPHLRSAYGLSLSMAGLLLSVLWIAYAIGQLPGGILSDRMGAGTVMVGSTLISAGTVGLVVLADSPILLFVATAMLGLGTALYGVVRFTALSDIYPEQVGTAVGVTMAAGDAGNAILPPIAGFLAVAVAWQLGFGVTIPLFLVVAVGLWIVVPARTSTEAKAVDRLSIKTITYICTRLRNRSVAYGTLILVLGEFIWQAFTAFYPTYLIEIKGLSPTLSVGLFGLFFALGGVVKLLSGNAYDRIGIRRSLLIVLGTTGGTLVVLPFVQGFWPLVIITAFASSLLGFSTVALSYLTEMLPADIKGTGMGVVRTGYLLIGAVSPFVFGSIADRGFFDEAFWLLAVLAAVALAMVWRLPTNGS